MPDDQNQNAHANDSVQDEGPIDQSASKPNLESLNFVEPQYHTENLLDQIFQWVLQSGRKIIIFTEIIVLGVFISRFALDRKIHDLRENVESKKTIIESTKNIEIEHRRIQAKLINLEQIVKAQSDFRTWLDEFTTKIPQNLSLKTLTVKTYGASLSASASDASSFATFINLLITDPKVKTIVLTSSQFDKDTKEYKFSLDVNLKR